MIWLRILSLIFFDLIIDVEKIVEEAKELAFIGIVDELEDNENLVDEMAVEEIVGLIGEFDVLAKCLLPFLPFFDEVPVPLVLNLLLPVGSEVLECSGVSHGFNSFSDCLAPFRVH